MPLFNFNLKPSQPSFLGIDITRNRSSDSTVDVTLPASGKTVVKRNNTVESPQPATWRTKEVDTIIRAPRSPASTMEQEDFWTIKRCDAFDDDDDADDC